MATREQQIKNSLIYILPVTVGNILPFITLPIFTRILTKEDYGVFGLAQIYGFFMTSIANFGMTAGYERNFFQYYRDFKESMALLYSTLSFVTINVLITGMLTYIFRSYISKWLIGSAIYGDIIFWNFCAMGIMAIKYYYLFYFKNTENAKAFAWYTIDESILSVIFSMFMVVYLRIGVMGLVWGQLLASFLIFSILGFNFLRLHPITFDWEILKDCLKISFPLTPKIFFGVIGSHFDKYLIRLMSTIGGVGIYSIGQRIAGFIYTYMTAIQNVYSPQVYRRMFDLSKRSGESVGRYLTSFAYLSIIIALMISLFSEEVISLLTPKSYHGAIDIAIILTMFYGLMFFGKQPQLLFAKKTYIASFLTLVNIGLNILINIPFIMKWGAIGAAWGTLLAGLTSGAIWFLVSQHYYEIKWEYKKIGAIYFIFFISSILMILTRNFNVMYAIRLIIKSLSVVLYIFLGIKFKLITRDNFRIFKEAITIRKKPGQVKLCVVDN